MRSTMLKVGSARVRIFQPDDIDKHWVLYKGSSVEASRRIDCDTLLDVYAVLCELAAEGT